MYPFFFHHLHLRRAGEEHSSADCEHSFKKVEEISVKSFQKKGGAKLLE